MKSFLSNALLFLFTVLISLTSGFRYPVSLRTFTLHKSTTKLDENLLCTIAEYFFGKHEYDYESLKPLAFSKGLRKTDQPTVSWFLDLLRFARKIYTNSQISNLLDKVEEVSQLRGPIFRVKSFLLEELERDGGDFIDERMETMKTSYEFPPFPVLDEDKVVETEFDNLFTSLPLPDSEKYMLNDEYFAHMRVAGFNPVILTEYIAVDPKFPMTDELLRKNANFSEDSLQQAMQEHRLYIADYKELSTVTPATVTFKNEETNLDTTVPKFSYRPIGLFGVPKNGEGKLLPIALQGGQDPVEFKIKTPADVEDWKILKVAFNSADCNYHQLISHLGRTHLLLEPFVVVTNNLPDNHVIKELLMPHLEGTAFINWAAINLLVSKGGQVDLTLAGELGSELKISANSVMEPGFDDLMLERFLTSRGLMHNGFDFPFRDNAMILWGVVKKWVGDYIDIYYSDDLSVIKDLELQKWADTLYSQDDSKQGGKVYGFGKYTDGKVITKSYLVDVLTMVIFTGSVMHAAVNFPQRPVMSYSAVYPLAGYKKLEDCKHWYELLPPKEMAKAQLQILQLLGGVYYTKLGNYRDFHFSKNTNKDLVRARLLEFQANLYKAEQYFKAVNKIRTVPYTTLYPCNIPQSINI